MARKLPARAPAREPTEKQIHQAVIDTWLTLGVQGTLVATIPNMRASGQAGLTKGLPDLLVIGPNGAGFIELKTATGTPSKHQRAFVDICGENGVRAVITYGRNEPVEVLRQWGVIR